MKKLLLHLKNGGEITFACNTSTIGPMAYTIFGYSDGTISARRIPGGLMSPTEKPTTAGLNRILGWIDQN